MLGLVTVKHQIISLRCGVVQQGETMPGLVTVKQRIISLRCGVVQQGETMPGFVAVLFPKFISESRDNNDKPELGSQTFTCAIPSGFLSLSRPSRQFKNRSCHTIVIVEPRILLSQSLVNSLLDLLIRISLKVTPAPMPCYDERKKWTS
ncbi:hypothetical protein PoB_005814000 [Plakobranchus ocellatus]|uniref:Uncharacterized protein n=1 Tax=Plakobranchus ocellatus TaxID=259542 RepID=A0AAV4CJ74_9GAST|nr:hypothetical protein PoB_005814000 [Plakobranchus ocellatus]